METKQQTQEEMQQDIIARLALISQAVEVNLASMQKSAAGEEAVANHELNMLDTSACPIDPMERLLCESCQ